MTKKYRIHWKANRTGATGHGTGSFPKEEAQQIATSLNRDSDNQARGLRHWIKEVSN